MRIRARERADCRRMINATQNTDAGREPNGFYTYNRVLDGDRFLVWIR